MHIANSSNIEKEYATYDLFIHYNHPRYSEGRKNFFKSLNSLSHILKLDSLAGTTTANNLKTLREIKNKISTFKQQPPPLFFKSGTNLDIDKSLKFLPIACYSVLSFSKCRKSLKFLLKKSNPKQLWGTENEFVFSELITKVLSSKKHTEVLNSVALTLIDDSINFEENRKIPTGDIFKRVLNSAMNYGNSLEESRKITFELLATYALRGTAYFSTSEDDHSLLEIMAQSRQGLSLLFLSTAISYFDKIIFNKYKKHFSLPQDYISTSCQYGKPYHFWLAAYMSYLANTQGHFKKRTSFIASHLSGVAYELSTHSETFNGRSRYFNNIINSKKIDDINVVSAKVDIVFNSLGAGFGVSESLVNPIDSDAILQKSFKAGSIPYISIHPFQRWMRIVAPHAHLNMIVKP